MSDNDRPSAPLIPACRLFQRTSAKGGTYWTGRWGGIKVLILANRNYIEGDGENGHSHNLLLSEAPPKNQASQPFQSQIRAQPARSQYPRQSPSPNARRYSGPKTQMEDDAIPWLDDPPPP